MFDLKNFRKSVGLLQDDIAVLFNISQPRVSAMERTVDDLSPTQMQILKDNFGDNEVMKFYVSNYEVEKFKNHNLLHDPESPYEKMRQDYLELVKDLLDDNKSLRKEIIKSG